MGDQTGRSASQHLVEALDASARDIAEGRTPMTALSRPKHGGFSPTAVPAAAAGLP
jgi:hypothetical protein